MTFKSQKDTFINLWWFAAIFLFAIAGISFISIYNTNNIIGHARKNQHEITEAFKLLRPVSEWEIQTDKNNGITEKIKSHEIESILIDNAIRQLTQHGDIIAKESATMNNTLILWATVLTLISIIFIFLGFMQLRDRFSAIEEKRKEMDKIIQKVIVEVDYKIKKIHHAFDGIQDKKNEIENIVADAHNTIADITDKFKDLSLSVIEDLEERMNESELIKKNVLMNEKLSFHNLSIMQLLLTLKEEEQISCFQEIINTIYNDTDIIQENKRRLLCEAFYNLGNCYLKIGNTEEAIRYLNKAIEHYPLLHIYLKRASAFEKSKNIKKAEEDYMSAIKLSSNNAELYYLRGKFYLRNSDAKNALADFTKAAELNPHSANYFHNKGLAYAKINKHTEAIENFNIALKLNAEFTKSILRRGLSYKALKMIEEALDDFDKCISLDPENLQGFKHSAQSEINRIRETGN